MKKQSLKTLILHKKSIASFTVKGGANPEDNSGGSEQNPNSMDILKCSPASVIPNTDCGCA